MWVKEMKKVLELNNTELFYLEDFISKQWFTFVDTIVDKNNMSDTDKEIYDTLKILANKIRKLRLGK